MATDRHFDVTRETILHYLRESGGKVKRADLIAHFSAAFPEGREEKAAARAAFKGYVDGVALVRAESGVKYVCLRKKFREEEEGGRSWTGVDAEWAASGECRGGEGGKEEARDKQREVGAAPGSGYGNDNQVRFPHVFTLGSAFPEKAGGESECCRRGRLVSDIREMGNRQSFRGDARGSRKVPKAPGVPEIAVIEPSPLPVEDPMFILPLPAQTGPTGQVYALTGALGNRDGQVETERLAPGTSGDPAQVTRRQAGSHQDEDDGLLEAGSEGTGSPKGSRRHFIEVMMSSSPQVRRSLVLRNSICLSSRSDSDSVSLVSSNLDEDRAVVTLDPLEHEWMMCASDGEWASLHRLLAAEPGLVLRKDFITGFTCLHWAAKHGKAELLALVINFAKQHGIGVSVDVRSNAGYTPLHVAAMHGHMEVVKLLVGAYNADVEIRDYSGKKACQYLTNDVSLDMRDIIGAYECNENRDCTDGGRWRFPKVLQVNLRPLRLLVPGDPGDPSGPVVREKPVRRKSSFGRVNSKLERLRLRTSQIIHSTTFHDAEELEESPKDLLKSRPKTYFFG